MEKDAIVVRETDRTVRLSDFHGVGAQSYAGRMDIESTQSGGYRVVVQVEDVTLDETLDEDLFR